MREFKGKNFYLSCTNRRLELQLNGIDFYYNTDGVEL